MDKKSIHEFNSSKGFTTSIKLVKLLAQASVHSGLEGGVLDSQIPGHLHGVRGGRQPVPEGAQAALHHGAAGQMALPATHHCLGLRPPPRELPPPHSLLETCNSPCRWVVVTLPVVVLASLCCNCRVCAGVLHTVVCVCVEERCYFPGNTQNSL